MKTVNELYNSLVELILAGYGDAEIVARDPAGGMLWRLDGVGVESDEENTGEEDSEIVVIF